MHVSQGWRCYEEISRLELAEFTQRSQFNNQEIKQLPLTYNMTGLELVQSTADHFQQDYGLGIYSIALGFLL